jgi:hypothetical protein
MPSLIGSQVGGGTSGNYVGANFEKAAASTVMGTRALSFYKVAAVHSASPVDFSKANLAGTGAYTTGSSPFAKAIIALQGFVEMYAVLTPGTAGFIFVVATDTANGAEANSNTYAVTFGAAEAAVKDAIGADTSVTITAVVAAGTGVSIS